MRRIIKILTFFILLITCFAWMYCGDDDNPFAPGELAGTWNLVTFTSKTDNFTATVGQPLDLGNGVTLTVTGTTVLTETRYDFAITLTISTPGLPLQIDETKSAGTYSINGSTLTATEDGTGEVVTFTMSRSGNRVTFDQPESTTVWEKQ